MRRSLWSVVVLVALAGCSPNSFEVEIDPSKTTYSRDVRTKKCMGTVGREYNGNKSFSVFNVSCDEDVLALVPKAQGGYR